MDEAAQQPWYPVPVAQVEAVGLVMSCGGAAAQKVDLRVVKVLMPAVLAGRLIRP